MANPVEVVVQFEQAINSRNPQSITSLMTPDGEFIDSMGTHIRGTDRLKAAWTGYFNMIPDYSISHSEIFADSETVAMFGMAQGTFASDGQLKKENFWTIHAAWRAVVKNGKIAVWQVYADNEPVRAVMRKKT